MKKLISLLIRFIPRKYLQRFSGTGLRLISLFYAGSNVRCPICGKSYRSFLPYGRLSPRPNALCPNCQSLERHRLIWLYLQNRTDFFTTQKDVLHIAPEKCFIASFEKRHGDRYITADIESPLAKVKMDIHQIPFDSNHFDFVLCNHVLEHVDDDIKAMKEIERVLRPGGLAILQVPFFHPIPGKTIENLGVTDPRQRELLFGQSDHVRKYGTDYAERIGRSGLAPIDDNYIDSLTTQEILKMGLVKGEHLFGGRKTPKN